ncbi:MAG: 50S ribosomal protein L21 [Alphaproteobacteria bacterium]|jgi:large subunit ribosomal protein L21|nr:50S ribosomal protein L21 [Alphaproteobacteria bacterium]MDP7222655.1 50S ribosomal protein L21 [Alphaproteobacteria bacterium]
MFAVIRTGGKQYKVSKDDKIRVEKIDAKEGASVDCEVLFAEGGKKATVKAKVLEHARNAKVTVFKKKRRQNYRRTKGHKQPHTLIQITDVKAA